MKENVTDDLINKSNEKETNDKKKELLTSKRTLKPGQQILND